MNREQRRAVNKRYLAQLRQAERLYGGEKVCVICGKTFTGLGHNPAPVVMPESQVWDVKRRCCTECDREKVTPARREWLKQGKMWDDGRLLTAEEVKWLNENYPGGITIEPRHQEN